MTPTISTDRYDLYLGDANEVLSQLRFEGAIVTDPPYPDIKGGETFQNGGVGHQEHLSKSVGDLWQASWEWLKLVEGTGASALISFTSFAGLSGLLLNAPGKLVLAGAWHKPNAHPGNPLTPHYTLEHYVGTQLKKGFSWKGVPDLITCTQDMGGCVSRGERIRNDDGSNAHPTQKPLAVMMPLCPKSAPVICDPFMGTGTTGVAQMHKGGKFIGIERDPVFFELAAARLEATTGQFTPREFGGLFAEANP